MCILSDDLLDCKLSAAFDMLAKPYKAETSPPKQLDLLKSIRKAVSECSFLFLREAVALVGCD
jgi:hypothetical protein